MAILVYLRSIYIKVNMASVINISFSYKELSGIAELDASDQELVNSALKAAENAYAPYSSFRVGAAVKLASGIIITGTNVENAAFPSGICAERNVIANASSNHPGDHPVAIAVSALTDSGQTAEPVSPCGNCRQVLAEEEYRSGKDIRVILTGKNRIFLIGKVSDILPLQFSRASLKPGPR